MQNEKNESDKKAGDQELERQKALAYFSAWVNTSFDAMLQERKIVITLASGAIILLVGFLSTYRIEYLCSLFSIWVALLFFILTILLCLISMFWGSILARITYWMNNDYTFLSKNTTQEGMGIVRKIDLAIDIAGRIVFVCAMLSAFFAVCITSCQKHVNDCHKPEITQKKNIPEK
jgi:hypothetical protein